MPRRLQIQSRVSINAYRYDIPTAKPECRWSYSIFKENWREARLFGTVVNKIGSKWVVQIDIDGEESPVESEHLQLEDKEEVIIGDLNPAIPLKNMANTALLPATF